MFLKGKKWNIFMFGTLNETGEEKVGLPQGRAKIPFDRFLIKHLVVVSQDIHHLLCRCWKDSRGLK